MNPPKFEVGQVVFDKVNGVPRLIDGRRLVKTYVAQNSYYVYSFAGTGMSDFDEDELRSLTWREIGRRELK